MYYIGIDIGGTKTAVSLADENCNILCTDKIKTPACPDFSEDFVAICSIVDNILSKNNADKDKLLGIGISCPGPLNIKEGKIVFVETTGWKDINIVDMFKKKYNCTIILENDARCAAFAEAHVGSGKGFSNVVYFTVSTGVGGGICINGNILQGESGYAAELGHMSVQPDGEECGCGGRGCVQLYSSGTAIAKKANKLAPTHSDSVLHNKQNITALDVELAVRQGDKLATEIWDFAMEKLGIATSYIWQSLNPGVIIYGGGISNAFDLMEDRLLNTIKKYVYTDTFYAVNLRKATLGAEIGTTGAILLVHHYILQNNN